MKYPLVHVEWMDAQSVDAWTAVDQIDGAPARCLTAGFLVRTTAETYVVANSLEGDNACCVIVIPRALVTEIRTMAVGDELQTGLGDNE